MESPKRVYRLVCLVLLALMTGCTPPAGTTLLFSKEQAIARAKQDATQSMPEVGIQQARIDSVTAELTTLGEVDRRMGGQRGPGGYSPGQTPQSPVWWVVVRGYFQYEGLGAPPNPAPICEADERDFIFDARTGESVGESMPNTRCAPTLSRTAAPVGQALPTATVVPTSISMLTRQPSTPTPTVIPTCSAPTTTAPTSTLNPPTPGSLDPTFGQGGIVHSYTGDGATAMALQEDGKIVTVGTTWSMESIRSGFALHRYNPDGSLECTFNGGTVFANPSGDGRMLSARTVALQADGKIVVAGTVRSEKTYDDFALVRFNTDGSLDRTFGNDGIASTDLDGGIDSPFAAAIQSDGGLVVGGDSGGRTYADALALARFRADSSLDSSFGQDGKVLIDLNRYGVARALAIQADGKIVVAGEGNSDLKMFNVALLRYNKDGSLDPTFGNGGIVLTSLGKSSDSANALTIQPDDKLLVAGVSFNSGRPSLALLRYNPDGALDPTFGSGGQAINDLTDRSAATGVALQADGKIVVAGNTVQSDNTVAALVLRYNPDGTLDSAFGTDGQVIVKVGANDTISALVIQADGKILVAGTTEGEQKCIFRTCTRPSGPLLLRFLP